MGQLSDALETAGRQLEARLKAHGPQMLDGALRGTLPQSWRFETESETAVLRLGRDGSVSVSSDVIEAPAVIVRWRHEALVEALLSGRSNERTRGPPPAIRFPSDVGRRLFSLLGTSLGL